MRSDWLNDIQIIDKNQKKRKDSSPSPPARTAQADLNR